MRTIAAIATSIFVFGCAETEATSARSLGPVYDASGLPIGAYIGVTQINNGRVDIFFDPAHATATQIEAAPGKVCRQLGGTVRSVESTPNPSSEFYPTARTLEIDCVT